jgi:hypothetical protein
MQYHRIQVNEVNTDKSGKILVAGLLTVALSLSTNAPSLRVKFPIEVKNLNKALVEF